MTSPSQARSGKEKLPERLEEYKGMIIDGSADEGNQFVADCHIGREELIAELVWRYNAHGEMLKLLKRAYQNNSSDHWQHAIWAFLQPLGEDDP